jgi:tetratricopeptide (TPR) repeat protein
MEDAGFFFRDALKSNLEDRYTDAIAGYSKAIESDPSYIDAYIRRGVLSYKILKKYSECVADFDKAIELNPGYAVAYLHRGIVKCHLLKFDEALPDLDRAIELDPNDERAYLNRGKNKYVLKFDKEDVCADLEKAVKLGSTQAADMMRLFYGAGRDSIDATRERITDGIKKKAETLKR